MIPPLKLADLVREDIPGPEQNSVEWIMITRSDPGGSVPRWMVERGTPGGIIKDAERFLDWAAGNHNLAEHPSDAEPGREETRASNPGADHTQEEAPEHPVSEPRELDSSVLEVAPTTASHLPNNGLDTAPEDTSDDTASCASFATARSGDSSLPVAPPHTPEEKALARLLREKAKLTEKLRRQRSHERKKRSKDDEREEKLLEKHMREVEKREARYNKEMERVRKREEKRKGKQSREVIELKGVVEALTRQNLELIERVGELEGRGRRGEDREAEAEAVAVGDGPGSG